MSPAPPPDPNVVQRLAADPARSVWVGASAGTGKTKVLTDRVLGLLLAGTPPQRLLCLTFTKAAAAEMANRINDRLAAWAAIDEPALDRDLAALRGGPADEATRRRARRLFAAVLDAPGGMRIETIHAFCQALLRRFPLEASLAPHFQVMDDRDSSEMLSAAREEVLGAARRGRDAALAAAVETLALSVAESAFAALLADLAGARGRLLRLSLRFGSLARAAGAVAERLGVKAGETVDGAVAAACDERAFDADGCRRAAVALLEHGGAKDGERGRAMADWLAAPEARAAAYPAWRGLFLTQKDEVRKSLCTKAVEAACPGTQAILAAEAERLVAVESHLRAVITARATGALLTLGEALLDAYRRRKAGRAMLDYDDLILSARDLLERPGSAAWVLYKLDGGLDHILIDEAQDTNPDQWAVVRALSDEFFAGRGTREEGRRTVFAVGDPKQSIYSFQRADPAGFEAMRALLGRRVPDSGGLWNEVALTVSFRSTPAVLAAVDAVFDREEGRDGVLAPGQTLHHEAWRRDAGGAVELWPPVAPRPADEREAWKPPVERLRGDNPRSRLARLVAARIRAMLDGERLEARGRAIRPGDIMVLVRRRNAFVEELVRELKALAVPVAGTDRMVLTEQMAVMDLVALGEALLLPEDDLTLATVLKGPLVGLDEDALFALAWGRPGSLIEALRARTDAPPFTAALTRFERWRRLAERLAPHEFFARILAEGGKRRLLARLGPEAEDPLDEFLALTLAFERLHPPSLQGFLAWLGGGGVEIKRDLELGGGLVRIMTVHGAKGLQAPVVFLPDTLQAPTRTPALLWLKDKDGESELPLWAPRVADLDDVARMVRADAARARDQEYRRLLYVAMTRAEDRLIVCGWQTRRAPPALCWYNLIAGGLAKTAATVRDPFLAGRPEIDEADLQRLSCPQRGDPRGEEPLPPVPLSAPLPEWATRPPAPEPPATRPLAPSRPEGVEPPVRSPLGGDGGAARFRRGVLIHRLLQVLPDLDTPLRAAAAARFLGRPAWGLSRAEQMDIAIEVARILDAPDWCALFGPGSRAEVPVVGMIGERTVAGQIDRLLVTPDEVLIVDYKTGRAPPADAGGVAPVYLAQLAAYRALLAAIYPNRRVRCALLWTDGPRLMPVEAGRLDDALATLA